MSIMMQSASSNRRASQSSDRRRFHRIEFDEPIVARFGGERVIVTDIGVNGVGLIGSIACPPGRTARLEFEYEGTDVSILSQVRSCSLIRMTGGSEPRYRAGLRFSDTGAARQVRELMLRFILQIRPNEEDESIPPGNEAPDSAMSS
jgi:hypothetical protein